MVKARVFTGIVSCHELHLACGRHLTLFGQQHSQNAEQRLAAS